MDFLNEWPGMSNQKIEDFINVVKSDQSLAERLKAAADLDAVVAIAKEAGFAVSKAIADAFKPRAGGSWQLSNEELETVAGGMRMSDSQGSTIQQCPATKIRTLCISCK
jgi:predicted ribosomally synthesized peptide with nif11-like leader